MTPIRTGALWALAIALSFAMTGISFAATNLTLTWQPVTTDVNGIPYPTGTAVTYNVYGAAQGQTLVLLANVATTTSVRSNVNPGTLCYAVTALVGALESAQSSPPACATIAPPPPLKPAAPTNLKIIPVTSG